MESHKPKKNHKLFNRLFTSFIVFALLPLSAPCFAEHPSSSTFDQVTTVVPSAGVESDHRSCQSIGTNGPDATTCKQAGSVAQSKFLIPDATSSAATAMATKTAVLSRIFTVTPLTSMHLTTLSNASSLLLPSTTLQIHKRTVLLI